MFLEWATQFGRFSIIYKAMTPVSFVDVLSTIKFIQGQRFVGKKEAKCIRWAHVIFYTASSESLFGPDHLLHYSIAQMRITFVHSMSVLLVQPSDNLYSLLVYFLKFANRSSQEEDDCKTIIKVGTVSIQRSKHIAFICLFHHC